MKIEKVKLPKSMSYVLRSSTLENAMQDSELAIVATLVQGPSPILFDAFFWPPQPSAPFERVYVRAGAVEASQAKEVRSFVEGSVVPEFISWLHGILQLPINSTRRREKQEFYRGL
jgi:hypothetical protein